MVEAGSTITALLGPTNTGKTHRAVERMLDFDSGIIGLPLRLLAREIYDRVSARLGERQVALITGEEKRVPRAPRYWVCTVEAMPMDREVDFLAVDEIQLAAHHQRGHVFTDRLLRARGVRETWFMGAATMREMMEQLVPTASIRGHPRFSRLTAAGARPLSQLPPRTALIAFTTQEVYELADRVRRRRGGAAVVLGALSPRTRNAQVAMYQAGEVDFLVATDAIGMGLNMDVDHVAFASLHKFDGRRGRALYPDELGQIGGRAGRHMRDGTFGTLAPLALADDVAFMVQNHHFSPVRRVVWRSHELDFASLDALVASLKQKPRRKCLRLVDDADDFAALARLAEQGDIRSLARTPERVELLWAVCQVPDFRKLMVEHHASLLRELYLQLCAGEGRLDPDFVERQVRRLEDDHGDIDALSMRMEAVRTWSYVANQAGWLDDPKGWQARTREAEDRLSTALHRQLVERFVERRGGRRPLRSSQASRPRAQTPQEAPPPNPSHPFGQLMALRDSLERQGNTEQPVDDWLEVLVEAEHDRFEVDTAGRVTVAGEPVAELVRGADLLHPEVKLVTERPLQGGGHARLLRRLRAFARDMIDELCEPLRPDPSLSAPARGLLYQLAQCLGTLPLGEVRAQLELLGDGDRVKLALRRIVVGREHVFAASLLEEGALVRRAALCSAFTHRRPLVEVTTGVLTLTHGEKLAPRWCVALGFPLVGRLAIRADALERLSQHLRQLAADPPFCLADELAATLGCPADELERAVAALGYARNDQGFVRARRRRGKRKAPA